MNRAQSHLVQVSPYVSVNTSFVKYSLGSKQNPEGNLSGQPASDNFTFMSFKCFRVSSSCSWSSSLGKSTFLKLVSQNLGIPLGFPFLHCFVVFNFGLFSQLLWNFIFLIWSPCMLFFHRPWTALMISNHLLIQVDRDSTLPSWITNFPTESAFHLCTVNRWLLRALILPFTTSGRLLMSAMLYVRNPSISSYFRESSS